MMTKRWIIATVSAALIGVAAASQDDFDRDDYYERRGPLPFEVMDLDRDGVISADEHAKVRAERQAVRARQGYPMRNAGMAPSFEQIDADRDGSISHDEFSAWHQNRLQYGYPMRGMPRSN